MNDGPGCFWWFLIFVVPILGLGFIAWMDGKQRCVETRTEMVTRCLDRETHYCAAYGEPHPETRCVRREFRW